MSSLGEIIGKAVLPASIGQKSLTNFEIDLRHKFDSLRGSPSGYVRLAINLLAYRNAEGYDYEFLGIPAGVDVNYYVRAMNNPALVLDLNRPYHAQWPRDFIGVIETPHQLKQEPYWGRIPLFDPPNVARLADFAAKRALHR
jgi:hypothetical protein